jgi:hypothetical protein
VPKSTPPPLSSNRTVNPDIFAPTPPVAADAGIPVESSTPLPVRSSDGRKVVSYKIRPEVARRLRRFAHDQDRPIGHVAEEALIEYLERHGRSERIGG